MLSLSFVKKEGALEIIDVSENQFEYLYSLGISKKLIYKNHIVQLDEEKVKLFSVKLGTEKSKNRKVAKEVINSEIFHQLGIYTEELGESATLKESREVMQRLTLLYKLYKCFEDSTNAYFSYE